MRGIPGIGFRPAAAAGSHNELLHHLEHRGSRGGSVRAQCVATLQPTECGVSFSLLSSIHDVEQGEWDACASGADDGCAVSDPFVSWHFLSSLEASQSVSAREGWVPHHLIASDGESGRLLGCVPVYKKSHSQGEYVFDRAWARAYRSTLASPTRQGYYPKLQACVPFTPVSGARLLVRDSGSISAEELLRRKRLLARALCQLPDELGVSGLHLTFCRRDEWLLFGQEGFERRLGIQYHWQNSAGWRTFDDYLADLKQSRRKAIRQERNKVARAGVRVSRLRGIDITPRHWEAFHRFYLNTVEEKRGKAYLKRAFFDEIGRALADQLLLVVAEDSVTGELVAGALNVIGHDCIYGRNWGCSRHYDSLHFELCYYQAIEAALELGLPRVEAGAQGDHKMRRGYMPTLTYSVHRLRDRGFRAAVSHFLEGEREQMYYMLTMLSVQETPFKADPKQHLLKQGVHINGDRIIVDER